MNISSALPIATDDLKKISKAEGVTINDVMLCALSTSVNTIFKEKGETSKDIHLNMPVNIRFNFYKTREEVKIENKFSIMPLRIPLSQNM